jgi:hypothetical protein
MFEMLMTKRSGYLFEFWNLDFGFVSSFDIRISSLVTNVIVTIRAA